MRSLFERRVPQVLGIYAGASWALVECVAFIVDEFLLSPHWPRVVMSALLLLFPSVAMLGWFHGRPGRDKVPMAEKIGVPVNVAIAAAVLILLFRGADLGARTTTAAFELEGTTVERTVTKPEFRKRTALSRFDAGPGLAEEEFWLTYLAPLALELDLAADDFFEPVSLSVFNERVAEYGLQRAGDIPLALRRAVAELLHATFIVSGTIDRFMGADGESRDWTVELKKSALFNDGTVRGDPARDGIALTGVVDADVAQATVWTIGGTAATAAGSWSGALKDTADTKTDTSGVPKVATGTFHSVYSNTGRMVGAFGAKKQ